MAGVWSDAEVLHLIEIRRRRLLMQLLPTTVLFIQNSEPTHWKLSVQDYCVHFRRIQADMMTVQR